MKFEKKKKKPSDCVKKSWIQIDPITVKVVKESVCSKNKGDFY